MLGAVSLERKQILGALLLLAFTAAVIGADALWGTRDALQEGENGYEELLSNTPVAELEGESVSPDGRFEARTVGKTDNYVSGVVPPESIQFVNRETGEVLWEEQGWATQSVLWSPDSRYLALTYGARTWQAVKFIETDTWTSWDFTLPDGSPIPEYTFLPADQPWGTWIGKDVPEEDYDLLLTVGRGGDEGEQHTYRCSLLMDGGQLAGNTLEQTTEVLSEAYDFDHDGEPEVTELVTLWEPDGERASWYELHVRKADGTPLWSDWAAPQHVGWNSLFACTLDGEDNLLRYHPTMYQGCCGYNYQLFSLDGSGGESVLQQNGVAFDINWGSPLGHDFDPAAIASFMEDINGLLSHSRLLLTTDDALEGIDPAHPRDDLWWLTGNDVCLSADETGYAYDETCSLEENLQRFDAVMTELARQ